jgi:branched-chain amino acid aminotransferase
VVTTQGFLSEGTASNLFLEVDGVLCTPSMATGCLAGVTRDLLLEHLDIVERDDLTLDDLSATSEAFLSASTRDVHPIATVDDRRLPLVPGPLTRGAAARYAAVVASSTDP